MSDYSDLLLSHSPLLWWRLGEPSGATAEDASPNNRDGTYNGSPTYGVAGPIFGDSDTAVTWAVGAYTSISYNPFSGSKTFQGWNKATAGYGSVCYVDGLSSALAYTPSGSTDILFKPDGVTPVTWAGAMPTGSWFHWVVTYDGSSTAELFINGTSQGTRSPGAWGSIGNLRIGTVNGLAWCTNVSSDEFAIFDGVLSSSQVSDLYEYGTSGMPQPTYFPLVTREYPPTRLHVVTTTPSGKHNRWGSDERRPEDIPKDLSFSTVMPGGFEAMDCTLPRKTGTTYQDLDRLSEIKVYGAGGEPAWEGRLEKTPRVSGDERSVNPQAVGWQAHLEDDAGATFLGVDRDLTHWGPISRTRREALYTAAYDVVGDSSVEPDAASGVPALKMTLTPETTAKSVVESLYDGGAGQYIDSIYYDFNGQGLKAAFEAYIGLAETDAMTTTTESSDLIDADDDTDADTFNPEVAHRYGYIKFLVLAASHANGDDDHVLAMRRLTVWGNHGLTKRGDTVANQGLYASDVIAYVVGRWAPLLNYTTGANGTIKPSAFIIPQLEFRVATTAAEIVKQANRFSLDDWWVDFDRTFHYAPRDSHGRKWRARVAPAQLEETGPSVDRLWNGVITTYQSVDGSTKTVGPTGAGTDNTDAVLLDTDPLNPVNQLGMTRYTVLDMGMVSTLEAATEVGRQFLIRSKELDRSGSAQLVGHVEDDHGVFHPSWKVKAGDQITFVDASDTSYRRIVKASYEHDSRTCSVDLDAPPEGLESLLERLSVSQYTAVLSRSPVIATDLVGGHAGAGGPRGG